MTETVPQPKFWDNFIPLRPSLSGTQLAGWQPEPSVNVGLGCQLLFDQRIPVDKGVSLSADVYTPRKDGRYPAIVAFSAYNNELDTAGVPVGTNEIGSPPVLTGRGYVHVVVSRRGMGRSGGETGVFMNDRDVDDHERVIAWAAEQPWCDGNVVLFGTSYYGIVQLQVAARRPPALKAFFAHEICTDLYRHLIRFGGVPPLWFASLWLGSNFTESRIRLRVPPMVRALISQIANSPLKPIWQSQVKKRMNRIMLSFIKNTPVRQVREWYVNWLVDGKTRETNCIPAGPSAELGKIEVPFVVVQNLAMLNLHQFGSYDLFENAGTPEGRKWMIIEEARYELPVYAWQLEALAFFDYIVKGANNGYAAQEPVRYWLDGLDRYVGATSFPPPGSQPVRLHLTSGGGDREMHGLSRTGPPAGGTNSWTAVPIGLPLVGGFDEVTNQTLAFETKVDEEVEFSGPITAHLKFSCNEIDSYVFVRLGRVDASGGYHMLSLGTISPARRRIDKDRSTACEIAIDVDLPEPLTPGKPVNLIFSLTPGPTQLRPGERLRFEVGSRSDLLRSDPSHDHVHFDLPAPPYFSRNTLHFGSETYLEVWQVQKKVQPMRAQSEVPIMSRS